MRKIHDDFIEDFVQQDCSLVPLSIEEKDKI